LLREEVSSLPLQAVVDYKYIQTNPQFQATTRRLNDHSQTNGAKKRNTILTEKALSSMYGRDAGQVRPPRPNLSHSPALQNSKTPTPRKGDWRFG